MGLICGYQFVFLLDCEDKTDFDNFRLRLYQHPDFHEEWSYDYPMFGLRYRDTVIDVLYHDPEGDNEGECLPFKADNKTTYIYAKSFSSKPIEMPQLKAMIDKMEKILKSLKTVCPERNPRLHMEPCWA